MVLPQRRKESGLSRGKETTSQFLGLPITEAVEHGHVEVVQLLLSLDAVDV